MIQHIAFKLEKLKAVRGNRSPSTPIAILWLLMKKDFEVQQHLSPEHKQHAEISAFQWNVGYSSTGQWVSAKDKFGCGTNHTREAKIKKKATLKKRIASAGWKLS